MGFRLNLSITIKGLGVGRVWVSELNLGSTSVYSFAGFRSGSVWVLRTWGGGGFAVPEVLNAETGELPEFNGGFRFFFGGFRGIASKSALDFVAEIV